MRVATVKIKGLTPYSQSRRYISECGEEGGGPKGETRDQHDERVWREHCHVDRDGDIIIPATQIHFGLIWSAAYVGKLGKLKKEGGRGAKWTENFTSGLAVAKGAKIGVKLEDVTEPELVPCNPEGRRGGQKQIWRRFPVFPDWSATLVIHILDDDIPEEKFRLVLEAFGLFNGLGRHRPQKGGYLGRFIIVSCVIK